MSDSGRDKGRGDGELIGGRRIAAGVGLVFLAGLSVGVLISSPGSDAAPGPQMIEVGPEASETRTAPSPASPVREIQPARSQESASRPAAGSARHTPTVAAVARVSPSVVSIFTSTVMRRSSTLLDQFMGRTSLYRSRGLGSGFAIDRQGLIVTNDHVVSGADSIIVQAADGLIYPANLIGSDPLTDIAVLKIDPDRIPAAPLGTSTDLVVGEPAIALGNPVGYSVKNSELTVTVGVISGVGRDMVGQRGQQVLYADMIQTDAAINPGNSGGALVNADGEVIGVNASIYSRSGGSEGLGFAIPIDRALLIADELSEFGRIRRRWVGVDVAEVAADSMLRVPIVSRVAPDSPGEEAGLVERDVVLEIDGRAVGSPIDWDIALLEAGIGAEVEVRYARDGEPHSGRMRIGELPTESAERVEVLEGLRLVTLSPQIAQERGLNVESGALIVEVSPRVNRSTRLLPNDVILSINGREVASAEEAAELFRQFRARDGVVRIGVNRNGGVGYTQFRIG